MAFDPKKLQDYPQQSGVYLMKNAAGTVLYVGKANNLRQRLRQYFVPGGDGRFMIPFLIAVVQDIETIVVTSEKEALLLENTLIKEHQPKFNAILKDDKSYIALRINRAHPWPLLELIREQGSARSKDLYFGPYTSAAAARMTFDLLNRLFPLRQCSDQEFARRTRPCLLYDIKRCIAPCVNKCTKEEYEQNVNRTIQFLRGQDQEVLQLLKKEMGEASERLEFERAGEIYRKIQQIERLLESQNVYKPFGEDADALAIFREGDEVIINQMAFRGGKLMGSRHFDFAKIAEDDDELMTSFLLQHYSDKKDRPRYILLEKPLDTMNVIEEILTISLVVPQRGHKKAWVEMAQQNAEAVFKTRKDKTAIIERTLQEMQDKFRLSRYPTRIECIDNSHIAGSNFVSVVVSFCDGKKDTGRYRTYKVKNAEEGDDYGAMREVLTRRYTRSKEENDLPDLLIVDGGKGHLNAAMRVLKDLDIVTIDVISVAKEAGRHDKGITAEQVFLPNAKDPIILHQTSPILFFLQRIRDEAHRFAIKFHQNQRSKKAVASALDEIPGIGPSRKKALLRHFGSVKQVMAATREELEAAPGMTTSVVDAILVYRETKNEQK